VTINKDYILCSIDVSVHIREDITAYISSSFQYKGEIKSWGSKWNPENKKWYIEKDKFFGLLFFIQKKYGIKEENPITQKTFESFQYIAYIDHPIFFKKVENEHCDLVIAAIAPFAYKDDLKELGFFWSPYLKAWTIPDTDALIDAVGESNLYPFSIDKNVLKKETKDKPTSTKKPEIIKNIKHSLLKKEVVPYSYQNEGCFFLLKKNHAIIADEMGIGKSLQALMAALHYIKERVCIICPAFLKYNWKKEWLKFTNVDEKDILLCVTKKDVSKFTSQKIVIANYEMIRSGVFDDIFNQFGTIILDEMHKVSHLTAQITEHIHHLFATHKPKRVYGLTGTPIQNKVVELYSLLKLLEYNKNPNKIINKYPTFHSFCNHFSYKRIKNFGRKNIISYEGVKNEDEIKTFLQKKMIRRLAKDHLDLPLFNYISISCILGKNTLKIIDSELQEAWKANMEQTSMDGEESISSVKARTAIAKAPSSIALALELIEQEQGPVVIFSDHRDSVDFIYDAIQKKRKSVARIYGGTPIKDRDTIVTAFQDKKIDALVCTIGAAGVGLTLTSSNRLIFNDLSWIPGNNAQAEKRIIRIGQKQKCTFYTIEIEGVDALISKSLKEKKETIKKVL
jgi:SWI/SNF-related matrix-associated actin-dependent regulator 1 of chromatin subfamily A